MSEPPSEESSSDAPRADDSADSGSGTAHALADVKQLGLFASLASLSYVFWVVGGMEMVERCAYYGVRAVAGLYAGAAQSKGGLGINEDALGDIFFVWALVQSLVPVFTGGLSDRFGYKETIFVSTIFKIGGYIMMAMWPTYWGFFAGAVVLATGTAIFKPGIQGTLVKASSRENSSMAWGVFYQTVNIGGWLGPLIAAFVRTRWGWNWVFYACSAIICINFILLLIYKEPGKQERLERARLEKPGDRRSLLSESLEELAKPHVWIYLAIFSGFWFMFNALFDVLPLHIRDWVNTQTIVQDLFGATGTQSGAAKFFLGMNKEGTAINPEGMLNLNAGLIMITCFLFAWMSGKVRATTSMVIGTLLATAAMFLSGFSTLGWLSLSAILVFSVGEMLSSPKFSEFIGNFAPSDKKAMYLGFSQIPLAIGWSLEGKLGPMIYGHYASKDSFSRDLLVEKGMPAAQTVVCESGQDAGCIKQGEAFDKLVEFTKETPEALTQAMYESHQVGTVWVIFGAVGIVSAIGIYMYGRWVITLAVNAKRNPAS